MKLRLSDSRASEPPTPPHPSAIARTDGRNLRVLVGQAAVGNFHDAFADGNKPTRDLKAIYLRDLAPRAAAWCAVNGYDYMLLTQTRLEFSNKNIQFHAQKLWFLSQWDSFDYFIWLDADVLITRKALREAKPFPLAEGFVAVRDLAKSQKHFCAQDCITVERQNYFNSGVWSVSKQSAQKMWPCIRAFAEGRSYQEFRLSRDQCTLNQVVKDCGVTLHLADSEWNQISGKRADNRRAYAIHFAGSQWKKPGRIRRYLRRY